MSHEGKWRIIYSPLFSLLFFLEGVGGDVGEQESVV